MKKQVLRTMITALILTCLIAVSAFAAPRVKKVQYKGNGRVEIDFRSKVSYRNAKVSVRDNRGNRIGAVIIDRDDDDIEIRLLGYKAGKTYTIKVSGIRKRGEANYGSVKAAVKLPQTKGSIPVREIEYDNEDRDVEFSFSSRVEWKNPRVTISDGKNQYVIRIKDRDPKEIEVRVRKLKRGKTYKYTISGIRRAGSGAFTTISGTFTA